MADGATQKAEDIDPMAAFEAAFSDFSEPGEADPKSSSADELIDRLSQLMQDQQPKEEPKAEKKEETQEEAPLYSDEEQQLLDQYQKDWPDVAQAEQLMRRGEYRQIVQYVFSEIAKELQPLIEQVQAVSQHTHLSQLQERVSDYEDVRDKVVDWVGTQPEYLQNAYNHVIAEGTADEVADLIDRYKRETGQHTQPEPPQKQDTELPSTTKKAAASLAPVRSKRSAIPQTEDANDFDSAFERFAGKL